MNREPKFYNKNGSLTAYSFACGYIEKLERDNKQTQLFLDGGVWHVKGYDFNKHERITWECFDYLTPARKYFAQLNKQVFSNQEG